MASDFSSITEDFCDDLCIIRSLVDITKTHRPSNPRVRVVFINSATLLLAATFEEFTRQMARECVRSVIGNANSTIRNIPTPLVKNVWQQATRKLSRIKIDKNLTSDSRNYVPLNAKVIFDVAYKFCGGDLSQDIYERFIYNENHMRPDQINDLFKLGGINNICEDIAKRSPMIQHFNFGAGEETKSHEQLLKSLKDFFQLRNNVAHSLGAVRSRGPHEVHRDIDMFGAFGDSLVMVLQDRMFSE